MELRRRMGEADPGDPVYQIKITLRESEDPPVWRRLVVPAQMRLDRFSLVLQAAIGWTSSRLHAFDNGGGTVWHRRSGRRARSSRRTGVHRPRSGLGC